MTMSEEKKRFSGFGGKPGREKRFFPRDTTEGVK